MPSKGSRIITFRLPPDLELAVEAAIQRGNQYRAKEPWNLSTFILSAVKEKLSHLDRSSKRKKGKATNPIGPQGQKEV